MARALVLSLLVALADAAALKALRLRDGPANAVQDTDVDYSLRKYKVGEMMEFEVLEGPEAGTWVKCSITALGDVPDTYHVYAYSADPHKRYLKNIPVEILRTQAEQDAKRKAIEDAKQKIIDEELARRRAIEEAERKAREEAERVRKAKEDAERKAREEAEAKQRAEEEARRRKEEEEARIKAEAEAKEKAEREIREKAEREEKARQRKIYLKAKWEQVKAAKLQKETEAKEKADEAAKVLAEEQAREQARRTVRIEKLSTTSRPLADPENVKVLLRFDGGAELTLKVRRSLRLRALMNVACERMGLDPTMVRFTLGNKVFTGEETAERFGRRDSVIIRVEPADVRQAMAFNEHGAGAPAAVMGGAFEIGDFAHVRIHRTDAGDVAVPCSIKAKGSFPDSFDIHFMFSTGANQDVHSVPAKLLQKVNGKQYAASVKAFRENPDVAREVVAQLVREAEEMNKNRQAAQLEEAKATAVAAQEEETEVLDAGDFVELSLQDGSQVPCTIVQKGKDPDTYDLHFIFAHGELFKYRNIRGLPAAKLRHIRAKQYVETVQALKKDVKAAQRKLELAAQLAEQP